MNKKLSVILVGIIVAVAIAAITITVTENISTKSSDPDSLLPFTVDPPPGSWVKCATQHGVCMFEGQTKEVYYVGANGNSFNGTFSQSVECNNTIFGDPDHGHNKSCFYSGTTPTGPWVKCATQHGVCSTNNSTTVIKYGGDNGNWVYGTFYDDDPQMIDCNNGLFGDPDYGHNKNCYYSGTPPTAPWAPCATQGGNCNFFGKTMVVKYGGENEEWVYGTFEESAPCNNTQFGDPDYGNNKSCSYRDNIPKGPWTQCATEGDVCKAPQSTSPTVYVRYGGLGHWVYGIFIDQIDCNNTVFGDVYPGVGKSCFTSTLGH